MNKIGIIGAMGEEVSALIGRMENVTEETKAGMKFVSGVLCGRDAVVVESGVGKVNMAMCAQIMADCYEVSYLINTGVAGALDPRLTVGDIVVASDAVQHDMDATMFGDALGQVPRMDTWEFPTDKRLAELAFIANEAVNPHVHAYSGRVVSGDQFIADARKKNMLVEIFNGACCEMEGAAMAHVAYRNEIPCLILRAISDQADGNAPETYETFLPKAIANLVRLLTRMLPEI